MKEIKTIAPSTQYNETFESLQELYKQNNQLLDGDEETLNKLKQYNPYLFPSDDPCVEDHCTIIQMYPRLFNYRFRTLTNIQNIQSQSVRYYLFNVFTNIRKGKLFQNNINVKGIFPIPDVQRDLFTECQSEEWSLKILNQQYNVNKICLFYDRNHILLCEQPLTDQQIKELSDQQVDFNPDTLSYLRYMDYLPQIGVYTSESTDTQIDLSLFFKVNNIQPQLEEALRKIYERKKDISLISNVGDGIRLQQKLMQMFQQNQQQDQQQHQLDNKVELTEEQKRKEKKIQEQEQQRREWVKNKQNERRSDERRSDERRSDERRSDERRSDERRKEQNKHQTNQTNQTNQPNKPDGLDSNKPEQE